MNDVKSIVERIRKFFFDLEIPFGLALCRMFLSVVLLAMMFPRWMVCRELYSADGATGQLSRGFIGYDMLPEYSGSIVAALYTIMLFTLLTMGIGWCTRISSFIAFVLFSYFSLLDAVSTMTKYTAISSHLLLLLSISPAGAIWSVDSWFARRTRNADLIGTRYEYPRFPAWPRRLMQFHIAIVYFGAAVTKIKTPTFFTGDQLQYWMLTHLNYRHPIGEFFASYPFLLVAFGYVVVVWEIIFIFTAWKSSWRSIILPIGVLFHFMTTLTLGLILFPMVCYCCYLSYFDEDDMRQSSAWFRRLKRKNGWLKSLNTSLSAILEKVGNWPQWDRSAKTVFAFALPIVAFVGIGLEYQYDIYEERNPAGKPQLVQIEPERARRMLAPVEPQRDIDKFFAVDMGTFMISDFIVDRRRAFHQGERVITQCNLVPPHEDMQIQAKIRDADNHVVERMSAVATREMARATMYFRIADDMPPGDYTMSIETAGRHVLNKKLTVLPKYGTVASR